MLTWQLQEAKIHLTEVVGKALSEGPQGITLNGELIAVLLSRADYLRLTQSKPGFLKFMRQSPLREGDLPPDHDNSPTRDLKL